MRHDFLQTFARFSPCFHTSMSLLSHNFLLAFAPITSRAPLSFCCHASRCLYPFVVHSGDDHPYRSILQQFPRCRNRINTACSLIREIARSIVCHLHTHLAFIISYSAHKFLAALKHLF